MRFEEFYLLGVWVSIILSSIYLIKDISLRLSPYSSNLKKIGVRISASGSLQEVYSDDKESLAWFLFKYIFILSLGFAFSFLSWLNVAYIAANATFHLSILLSMSEKDKIYYKRMRTLILPRADIVRLHCDSTDGLSMVQSFDQHMASIKERIG